MKKMCMAALALAALLTMTSFSPALALTDYVFISVNGDTSATTVVQGDQMSWGSNCAVGADVQWEIWADLNLNSIIEEGSDYLVVSYISADGDTASDGPPPDSDPLPDGWYITMPFVLGVAPTNYIFRATDLSDMSAAERAVLMQALSSPPNQITGTVTMEGVTPPDNLLENIWVQAESDSIGFQLWSAFTDNTGAYAINIGAAGSGITFNVFPGIVQGFVTPPEQYIVANGVVSGVDFVYGAPADSVYGYVVDPGDNPIAPVEVWCSPVGGSGEKYYASYDGYYVIYFTSAELGEWWLGVSDNIDPQYMVPQSFYFDNSVLHSFQHDLVCPLADTVINFTITESGGLPTHQYRVQAYSSEIGAYGNKITNAGDSGLYQIGVSSDQSAGYFVMVSMWDDWYPIPPGYTVIGNYSGVMPGDTVSFSVVEGKLVCGNVNFDSGDETIPFDQVDIRLNGANGNYMAHPAGDGSYQIAADTGFYNHTAYAISYLSSPGTYSFYLSDDTCGFSFTLNKQHEHIVGQLTGVTLPLSGNYWVTAGTATFPFGYHVSSEQVVNATGEFHIYVCDGNWTFNPPTIPGYPTPEPQFIVISENRDTTISLVFDYSSTDAPDGTEPSLPNSYALNQNHPNPFNAGTAISFELPERADMNITVYNILGQPVAVIAQGSFPAGSHTVEWNGKSENGAELSSGIYFYRMTAGQRVFVKKMVVLK